MTAEAPRDWARPVVHWHLEARDPDLLRGFYATLFSWDIADGGIMSIGPGIGGPEPGPGGHIQQGAGGVTLYIQVRSLTETIAQAEALGGSAGLPPFDVPGGPRIAGIADPEGNSVMLVQQ